MQAEIILTRAPLFKGLSGATRPFLFFGPPLALTGMKPAVTANKPSLTFICACKTCIDQHNTSMNFLESVNSGIAAFHRATQGKLASRAILVHAVLQLTPRAEVFDAMAEVAPDGKKISESTLRRRIVRTTRQMGLPPLPTGENGGRPSFEVCDQYKMEHCSKWISDNGGMPRAEQLADPNWDLRPSPPPGISTSAPETTPAQITLAASKDPMKEKPPGENTPVPSPVVKQTTPVTIANGKPEGCREVGAVGDGEETLLDDVPQMPKPFRIPWNDPWEDTWKDHFGDVEHAGKLTVPEMGKEMQKLSLRLPHDRWVSQALVLHARAHGVPYDPSHYKRYLETIRIHYKKLLKEYWQTRE